MLGLKLAEGGWVEVDKLIAAARKNKFPLDLTELKTVVEQNDKQRFAFDSTGKLIRANQGYSVAVDLGLRPLTPPEVLYQGTHKRALKSILQQGLSKMQRHHVHLSSDFQTAANVGHRRGKPVVLEVLASEMNESGFLFYLTDNDVWLVDRVPAKYLKLRN